MTQYAWTMRRRFIWITYSLTFLCGCQASSSPQNIAPRSDSVEISKDVDQARALMSLHQIKPSIKKPHRSKSVKPLSDRAAKRIETASKLVAEQRFTEAALELERALRYDPSHPDIHRTLAILHWQAGNIERARTHALRALESHHDIAAGHYILGRDLTRSGNDRDAITAYRTAMRCSDFEQDGNTAALCHYYLAQALENESYLHASLKQYQVFEKTVAQMAKDQPSRELLTLTRSSRISIHEAKSRMFEKLGRFAEAARSLETIINTSELNIARNIRYARLLMRAGDTDKALTIARAIDSDNAEVIKLLFDIYEKAGHPEKMLADLRQRVNQHPNEPRFMLSLADILIRLNRLDEIRRELQHFLDQSPASHRVRERLVDVYIKQHAWVEAIRVCSDGYRHNADKVVDFEIKIAAIAQNESALQAILDQPDDQNNHITDYLRGMLADKAGRMEEAETLFNRCYEKAPDFIPVRYALGLVYLKTYRYEDALRVVNRKVEDEPEDARLELMLGKVYERLDELKLAQLHLRAANQLDRTHLDAMYSLANVYYVSRKINQAQRQLRVLLEIEPNHENARELLAQLYSEQGKRNEAVEHIKTLIKRSNKPTTIARCRILLDPNLRKNSSSIRDQLLQAIEEGEPDAETWIAIALTYDVTQLPQKQQALRRALALEPAKIDALQLLEDNQRRLLEFEQSVETRKQRLQIYPRRNEWRLHLIKMYWDIQLYQPAYEIIQQELDREEIDPQQQRSYRHALLNTHHHAKQNDEILNLLTTWSQEKDAPQVWSRLLADEFMRLEKYEQAVPIYEKVYRKNISDNAPKRTLTEALHDLANALMKAGRLERATQFAMERLSLDPDDDNAVRELAVLFANADHIEEMKELIQNRLLHTLNRNYFQNLLIDYLRIKGYHDEGIEYIESLIDEVLNLLQQTQQGRALRVTLEENRTIHRLPNKPFSNETLSQRLQMLRFRYALGLLASRDYLLAKELCTTWIDDARNPRVKLQFIQYLAAAHRGDHHEDQATTILERALQLDPNNISLNNDISYSWIDRGIRMKEAEQMIRFAVYSRPRQRAYLDTYGWLLYKKGEFAKAKIWLLRALNSLGRDDPVVYDHLGDTFWQLGQKAEAIEYWNQADQQTADIKTEDLISDDERRVQNSVKQKIDSAQTGSPKIAPLAQPENDTTNKKRDQS